MNTDYEHGKLYVYDATSQTFDLAAPPSLVLDAGREAIAKLVWQRFAPTHHIGWTDETHRAEYLLCADDILALTRPQPGGAVAGTERGTP